MYKLSHLECDSLNAPFNLDVANNLSFRRVCHKIARSTYTLKEKSARKSKRGVGPFRAGGRAPRYCPLIYFVTRGGLGGGEAPQALQALSMIEVNLAICRIMSENCGLVRLFGLVWSNRPAFTNSRRNKSY